MTQPDLPWHQSTMVGFDLETTGVDTENDRAVTATVIRSRPGEEPEIRNWLIDPGIDIKPDAAAVHGISTEYAREHGRPAAEAIGEIGRTLVGWLDPRGGPPVPLVIYNAPFDHTMFDRECRRYDYPSLFERAQDNGFELFTVDPLVIDKAANKFVKGKGQRQLTPTCARYGIVLDKAHESEADVLASIALARAQGERYAPIGGAALADLQRWQVKWHTTQTNGFADFLLKLRAGKDDQERAELETKAASVRAEAGQWPIRPWLVD